MDHYIRPYVSTQSSYIKDTYDFLEKTREIRVTENIILATIDVSSLYTSIPHKEGIEAVEKILQSNNHISPPIPTTPDRINSNQ